MTTTNTISPELMSDEQWSEAEWAAASPWLADLLDQPPLDDDSAEVRTNAIDFAERRAMILVSQYPTEQPGRPGRMLLTALRDVRRQRPTAAPEPKTPPQSTRAAARLASELAADPTIADRLPVELVRSHDLMLGGPDQPLASYFAQVDAAREQLAEACIERLSRIPVEWRRAVGAATPDERRRVEALNANMGAGVEL